MSTVTLQDLEAQLATLEPSPTERGTVELVVRRPDFGEREVLDEVVFDAEKGVEGDNWLSRGSRHTDDGSAHRGMQVAIMNSRIIGMIAGDKDNWAQAGDQLFVDFDISAANMPAGQRFAVGEAILEVSEIPHNGCAKFTERYGSDATRFVNGKEGRAQRRRGINATIVQTGTVRVGDVIRKLDS